MRAIYSLNIFFYGIAIRIASLFNAKAKLWLKGRRNLFSDLKEKIKVDAQKVAWFHCASLGEFEQGRPLLEKFKIENPEYKILLTFFSPSGYEVRKNYSGADVICYLPLDTKSNAKKFIEIVKPSIVFFVKYEFWLNHLKELEKNKIPHFLICAIFRKGQVFFKWHGNIFRDALKGFTFIFTQEKNSVELLNSISISNVAVAGDTRFDRVSDIAANRKEIPIAKSFSGMERKVIVAGSTWPNDEELFFPAIKNQIENGWKLIIAPHELGESHLLSIENGLKKNGVLQSEIFRFSQADQMYANEKKVLIIDNIGMLSSLYAYGKVAYIGGGFGKSIHNILEAAVFGMPVIFGPKHEKFHEAKQLLELGGAFAVNSEQEIKNAFDKICGDEIELKRISKIALDYVQDNSGATNLILEKTKIFLNR